MSDINLAENASRELVLRWGIVCGVAVVAAMIVAPTSSTHATEANAIDSLKRLAQPKTQPRQEYRAIVDILKDPALKSGALRLIDISAGRASPALEQPSARTLTIALAEPQRKSIRSLEVESATGAPQKKECSIKAYAGARQVSEHELRGEPIWMGAWVGDEQTAKLVLTCKSEGFWGGTEVDERSFSLLRAPERVECPNSGVTLKLRVEEARPNDRSGADASHSAAVAVEAAGSPAAISPYTGSVSYSELDATDFVQVFPRAAFTSALICSKSSLEHSVRATRDELGQGIGAFVFDGRCLSVSVNRWESVRFQIVAAMPGEAFEYEIFALSGSTKPDLVLVAWYVAKHIAPEPRLTQAARSRMLHELFSVFDLNLERDQKQVRVLGDPTAVSYLNALADTALEAP